MQIAIFKSLNIFILTLLIPFQVWAQLCVGVSESPVAKRKYKIPARAFLKMNKDFDIIDERQPHTILFVLPKKLNVRSAPEYGPIVGTLFNGQKIRVFGRQDKWIAFRPYLYDLGKKSNGAVYWAHIDYLSFAGRNYDVSQDLEHKCSIHEMVEHLDYQRESRACLWVAEYLYANKNTGGREYNIKLIDQAKLKGRDKAFSRISSQCY